MKGKISDMAEFQLHAVIIICVMVGEGEIFADAQVVRCKESRRLYDRGSFILTFHHPHCQLVVITILL